MTMTFFTRAAPGSSDRDGHDPPADELDAEEPIEHLGHVEGPEPALADDVLDGVLAVHQLEDGQLFPRQAAASHLRHRVLVAQEDDVEVVDLALDQVPLVDPPEALHEDPLDVEAER